MTQPNFNQLTPIHDDYATLPIAQGFTWESCFQPNHVGELYLVVFRSILKPTYDVNALNQADERALVEASSAPGFVHYFCGTPTATGLCLSLCLWNSREQARAAAKLPAHQMAVALVRESYQFYRVETYRVIKSSRSTQPEIIPYVEVTRPNS
jgi:heme-degrading monooxygenase HmoA